MQTWNRKEHGKRETRAESAKNKNVTESLIRV
jgi:hypothetical protein